MRSRAPRFEKKTSAAARRAACLVFLWPALGAAEANEPAAAPAPADAAAGGLQRVVVKSQALGDGDADVARASASATGLNLSLRDTPQSISVTTRTTMDDFRLDSVNDLLGLATGIVVEKVETDRTYYTARGFDIVNFQLDGVGTPFVYGLVDGDLDTAVYERVEVIRGAAGLVANTGNPSATINFVRKRPTAGFQAAAGLSLGSWNGRRLDADVAGPLNEAGSVRGRLVLAYEDKDSYLDRYHLEKGVAHGIVEADLDADTLLTVGHTAQANRPRGNNWGALPLWFSDGSPTHYDTSINTAPRWTYWNADLGQSFVELRHQFANGWELQGGLMHKSTSSQGRLFYVYGEPDAATGAGTMAWPSLYDLDNRQNIVDLRLAGPFTLGGRTHELVFGASVSRSSLHDVSNHGEGIGTVLPDLANWDGDYPMPAFNGGGGGSRFVDKQRSLYAATRLRPLDGVQVLLGANATWIASSGESYGASRAKQENKLTPYIGTVVDLTSTLAAYGSYTTIFFPQSEVGADLNRLESADGMNAEVGLKAEWLDKRLTGTLALFRARQDNLATYARYDDEHGVSIYQGVDTLSQGVELELAGALTPTWQINAGYTQLEVETADGQAARSFTPRRLLRLTTTWQALPALKLGAGVAWQSAIHRDDVTVAGLPVRTAQGAYALVDLMARYDFDKHWSATLNIDNATDQKHFTSLYWSQSFYGAPRSVTLGLHWTY